MPRRLVAAAAAVALLQGVVPVRSDGAQIALPIQQSSLYTETDRDADKLLEAARKAARAKRWRQAIDAFQQAADFVAKDHAQPLVPSPADPAVLVPIQQAAALELARLPRAALELYRQGRDAEAKELVTRAVAAKDAARLAAVARRYLATSWGDDALAALGAIALDRGDHVAALAAWQRLLHACPDPTVSIPLIRARMWLCCRALGRDREARAIARDLLARHPHHILPLGNKPTPLAEFLKHPAAVAAAPPLDDWPLLGGDASRARLPRGIQEVGERAWTFRVPGAPVADAGRRAYERRRLPVPYVLHATVADGRLFVATDAVVQARDATTGRLLWMYPDAPAPPGTVRPDETTHAVACGDGRAVARLAEGILAFDAATGRVLWRHSFAQPRPAAKQANDKPKDDDEDELPAELGTKLAVLATPPVVAAGRVVFGITHLEEEARASVVALDAATGQLLWRTFVCSRTVPAFLGMGAAASPPAVAGSTVYHSTNLGAIAALDLATGSVRWLRRYTAFTGRLRQSIIERNGRWANNPPLVAGASVFAAPQDCARLLALDAVDGSAIWSVPRAGGRYVVGLDGAALAVVGRRAVALDGHTGKRLWATDIAGALAGRPVLCPGRLFVPTAEQLLVLKTHDGALSTARVWTGDERPGNLAVARGTLVVAACDRVQAFESWAHTRQRLEAVRRKQPDHPAVELALGSHEAHLGNHAKAIGHLGKALRQAREKELDPLAKKAAAHLFASYRTVGDAESLAKALELAPTPQAAADTRLALARLRERQGRWPEAIAAYQAAVEHHQGLRLRGPAGLTTSARAAASAEIARLIRQHGRKVYAAQETRAARRLAEGATAAQLEAIARAFPNSAAAEQALARRLDMPDARTMAAELTALLHSLDPDAASPTRRPLHTALDGWRRERLAANPPLTRRWQVQTRVAHREVERLVVHGVPPGLVHFATARHSYDRAALPFDGIECRRSATGQLVWERDLGGWNRLATTAGNTLVAATFDRLIAVDARSGVLRWAYSLADDAELTEGDLAPAPPPPGRRRERRRVVGLAATDDAVFASLAGGDVFAVSAADGKRLWGRELGSQRHSVALLARGLYAQAGKVWACAEHPAAVYALDAKDGSGGPAVAFTGLDPRLTDLPSYHAATARLYLVLGDHTVHAIDLKQGKELWKTQVDFGISRVLVGPHGTRCYVLPDSFAQNVQILSLDPATGAVRRRRSLPTGSLADAAVGARALYVAAKDTDHDLMVQALDPDSLAELWRTVPLQLFQPSPLAVGDGFVAVTGRHAGQAVAVLIHASNGKVAGDVRPSGVRRVSPALVDGLLCLATDRGIHAFGPTDPNLLDQRVAMLSARLARGDRAILPALANALYQRGEEHRAIRLLTQALADEALSTERYAALKDQLNSLRESLVARRPPVLVARRFDVPPNLDGAIDEPWRPELAAHLDGLPHIEEVQGIPADQSRWRSPSDLSAVLYTGWDDKHFYFAIDVSDDIHRTYTSDSDTWIGDGLIISIDCDNDGGYSYAFTGRDLLLTLALTRKDERKDDRDDKDTPKGSYRVRRKDDSSGTVYEVAIPWAYMKLPTPKPGSRIGFNITILDDDGDRTSKAVSWTPGMLLDRDRDMMIRGFTPAHFGDVLLEGPRGEPAPVEPPPSPDHQRGPTAPRPQEQE